MIPVYNFAFACWLLLTLSAGSFAARAYAGYRLKHDKAPLSFDEIGDEQPPPKQDFPFNDRLDPHYSPDGIRHDGSVASSTAPSLISMAPLSGSSQRNGWTPIIRSQTTSREHEGHDETRVRNEVGGVKRVRTGSPRKSRTGHRSNVKSGQFQRYDAGRESEFTTESSSLKGDLRSTFHYQRKKNDKVTLSENDIMRMHYGPPLGYSRPEIHQRGRHLFAQKPSVGKIVQRSYLVEESDENGEGEFAKPPPQNIYEVIDEGTPKWSTPRSFDPQVAGPTKRQTDDWQVDETSSENVIPTYKFGFDDRVVGVPLGVANETPVGGSSRLDAFEGFNNEVDSAGESSIRKFASRNIGGFVNFTGSTVNPVQDESLYAVESLQKTYPQNQIPVETSSSKPKSGRLLGKPIIIVDPPTSALTPEYYRQLFDSFSSGHYRQVETETTPLNKKIPLRGKKKWPPVSSTAETTAASPYVTVAGSDQNENPVAPVTMTDKQNETDKSDSFFFSIPTHQLMDLLPKTLKVNLIAVKRVLIDCYPPNDKNENKSSSVNCFKKITFDILDKAIKSDAVKLTDTVSLVKDNETTNGQSRSATSESTDEAEWLPNIIEKIRQLFSTHALKVKLINSHESNSLQVEGRRRYRHTFRRIFPVVASIYMIITSVLIPLVFQFMALMAGKSFMVGKIALLFALFTSFNKFLSVGIENILPWYMQPNHASPSLPPSPPSPQVLPVPYPVPFHHYDHHKKDNRKKDTNVYNYSYTTKRVPINYTYYTIE